MKRTSQYRRQSRRNRKIRELRIELKEVYNENERLRKRIFELEKNRGW